MMDITCDCKVKEAIEEVLDDAHSHGAVVRFETLTAKAKDRLQELFPGRFSAESVRDYAEYIYTYDKLVNLSGGEMAGKRRYFNKFMREYGARTIIEVIRPEHVPEILEFHKYWLETKKCRNLQLEQENEAMHLAFAHYAELDPFRTHDLTDPFHEFQGKQFLINPRQDPACCRWGCDTVL